jgi:hypothetical protein
MNRTRERSDLQPQQIVRGSAATSSPSPSGELYRRAVS